MQMGSYRKNVDFTLEKPMVVMQLIKNERKINFSIDDKNN